MSQRRTKIEIIRDILKAVQDKGGEIKPTHLMYKSNLSHQKMMEYLSDLFKNEMIEEFQVEKGNRMYRLTPKGIEYLNEYRKIEQFSQSFGL